MARIHETLSGNEVRYDDPTPEVEAFLKRVRVLVDDPKASEDELVALLYGPENPILSRDPVFPGRGVVTREALENPVYHVLADLLARKHAAQANVDLSKLGARYTLNVAEAAERLKISEGAVRKAIQTHRVPSWRKNGIHYLDPSTFAALEIGKRGTAVSTPLVIRAGARPGTFLLVRTAQSNEPLGVGKEKVDATVERWRHVGVLTGGKAGKLRLWELEPSDQANEIDFEGYFVRGKFEVSAKVNNAAKAEAAWKEFRAI